MSRVQKLLLVFLGVSIIVYLFNCSVKFTPKKEINEKEIIAIALQNYDNEIQKRSETIDSTHKSSLFRDIKKTKITLL